MRTAGTFLVGLAVVLGIAMQDVMAQQRSDDLEKKLDAMMKRIEQQEKLIEAQGEKIQRQQETIETLQKPGTKPAGAPGAAETLSPKQEKQVEQLVDQYLNKEEVRIGLGIEQVVAGYKDGFFVASRDQAYKLKFTGYAQVDGRFMDTWTADTFLVRRARPTVEGTLGKYYNFKVQPDFGMGSVSLKDAYLDLGYFGDLNTTRLGKFKVPQGIEQLTSSSNLLFVERSLVSGLEPDRDVGVMTYGRPFNGLLEYSFGVWNGNDRTPWQGNPKDFDRDNNKDKDYGGRLQVNPFRTTDNWWLKGIQLGGWFNQGHEEDVPSSTQSVLTFSTAPGTTWFRTAAGNVRADGDRSRIGWDGTWFLGPVCVAGEMEWMRQNFKNVNPASIVGPPTPNAGLWNANGVGWQNQILPFNAWLVQASWLLTGEDATFSGVKPKNDFDPKKGTWGAFELAARYSRLDIGQHVFDWFNAYPSSYAYIANQANSSNGAGELTLGLNWYLNKNVKLMFNYVYTALDSAVPVSKPSGFGGSKLFKDEDAFLMRAQVKW